MPTYHTTNPADVQNIIRNYSKTILLYTSKFCGSCLQFSPVINKMKQEYPHLTFIEFDATITNEVTQKFPFHSTPTFYFFNKGQQVYKGAGTMNEMMFEKLLITYGLIDEDDYEEDEEEE